MQVPTQKSLEAAEAHSDDDLSGKVCLNSINIILSEILSEI